MYEIVAVFRETCLKLRVLNHSGIDYYNG